MVQICIKNTIIANIFSLTLVEKLLFLRKRLFLLRFPEIPCILDNDNTASVS